MSYGGSHGKFAKREGREKDKYEDTTEETPNGGTIRTFSVREGRSWIPFPDKEEEE